MSIVHFQHTRFAFGRRDRQCGSHAKSTRLPTDDYDGDTEYRNENNNESHQTFTLSTNLTKKFSLTSGIL